jgi:ribosome recycling factor
MDVLNDTKAKMESVLDHLREDLRNIRSGRANPGMLDGVDVEVYGAKMKIRDLATVSVPEARQLLVSPFDANNLAAISKGIEKANLGMMPAVDGSVIRLNVAPMDESQRKEMVKVVNKKREESKVSLRNVRKTSNDQLRKAKADGDLPEDQLHKAEKQVQELTDDYCKKADSIAKEKEADVMVV